MSGGRERHGARWYDNAVFYGVDVGLFKDTDGDGVGDFRGLTESLDYLAWLGVTALWVLPFYPSPNRDNGYDVADYFGVAPRHGTLADFREFVRQAEQRDIRVIVDLVVGHTSDQHPWFQAARSDPRSPYRGYYVWSDDPAKEPPEKIVFPGVEESAWEYDPVAGAYYLHHFYKCEPELETANPAVQAEIHRIADFWLDQGVAGFRVDAAPYLRSAGQGSGARQGIDDPHPLLRALQAWCAARRPDAALLAEADVEPDELKSYFGSGKEVHLLYNFLLNASLFLAFARQEAAPVARVLRPLLPTPPEGQWLNFLRNLDELDLERLTEAERGEVARAFAPDPAMWVYERGVRRRLAPLLNADRRRLELALTLLFGLPGSPLLVYGDEIGLGENLALTERNSVRTPMQWSSAANGGFSTAPPAALTAPPIAHGPFGYERVNVADQQRDPGSLLQWVRRLIHARRACPEIGCDSCTVLAVSAPSVVACRWGVDGSTLVTLANLAPEPRTITLDLADCAPLEMVFSSGPAEVIAGPRPRVTLDGYGYRWLRAGRG